MKPFGIFVLGVLLFVATAATAEIEEIVVTAQKRSESIQQVPISITALTGYELDNKGLNDMQDVARYVPNFDMPTANISRNTTLRIRGIGSAGSNPGIEASIGSFIDGLYMPTNAMNFGELTDISSVEILRGPQGTLYGRNTPVGAIRRILSTNPTGLSGRVPIGCFDFRPGSAPRPVQHRLEITSERFSTRKPQASRRMAT